MHAARAIELTPLRGASCFAVFPISTQVHAYTAMGRHDEAARLLNQSISGELVDRYHGIRYLDARGRHYLATGAFLAALDDFLIIAGLARRWAIDRPDLLPWRLGAAEALLRLGEHANAELLIDEQLAHATHSSARTRGMALRVKALTVQPQQRTALLSRALDELHRSRDRYQLTCALGELAQAYEEVGALRKASVTRRRAAQMAQSCGAPEPAESPACQQSTLDARDGLDLVCRQKLSKQEQRVAVLAADGSTNRQIAANLRVTPSTVEQHLTRVFRKLGIKSRQELVSSLRGQAG